MSDWSVDWNFRGLPPPLQNLTPGEFYHLALWWCRRARMMGTVMNRPESLLHVRRELAPIGIAVVSCKLKSTDTACRPGARSAVSDTRRRDWCKSW